MFQAGQQIGAYRLLRKIGAGGFGEVWLAERQTQFVTKKVAVKLPFSGQADLEAIRREATIWEQASGHPNVLPIIDADIYNGQIAIVSEYADGGSLADRLKQSGKLSVKQAVEMTVSILKGLEFLHGRRIIHRDIKPQNILLQNETPRLTDFGVSRAMQTSQISSQIVGTDAYMSPEAFDGHRTEQTDIWSVGVVLYQLLTGKLPFPQEHATERMFAILLKEPQPLSESLPFELKRIVFKALEKDRELGQNPPRRYQTAVQMREDLENFLLTLSQSSNLSSEPTIQMQQPFLPPTVQSLADPSTTVQRMDVLTSAEPSGTRPVTLPMAAQNNSAARSNRYWWLAGSGALALVLVSIIGLGGIYVMMSSNGSVQLANSNRPIVTTTPLETPPSNTATNSNRKLTEVVLPDGTKLQAYAGGIEDQLIKFIQSDEYKNGTAESLKGKWFNFDDLNFKFGTTEPAPESKRQLDNIAAILKAFPDVKIKIGAYTDKKGDDAANKKLSDGRAKAVKFALEKAGVGAQVPEAEGYGEDFATVPETASDEERRTDRKISIRLLK